MFLQEQKPVCIVKTPQSITCRSLESEPRCFWLQCGPRLRWCAPCQVCVTLLFKGDLAVKLPGAAWTGAARTPQSHVELGFELMIFVMRSGAFSCQRIHTPAQCVLPRGAVACSL